MGDSSLSASELRKRYLQGGSIPDSELPASQLRARYALPSNKPDFSTKSNGEGGNLTMIIVVVLVIGALGGYFLLSK